MTTNTKIILIACISAFLLATGWPTTQASPHPAKYNHTKKDANKQAMAVNTTRQLLWPKAAPGAKGNTDNDKPDITIFIPPEDKANGTAIVICPGGGYAHLAMSHEGTMVAKWLNSIGVAGFVLKYRHHGMGYSYPAPQQDVQRAIRLVRAQAPKWHLDPHRIGVMGFSAGGHLASCADTLFNHQFYKPVDNIDKVSCRPDFAVLLYPVITMNNKYTHHGSRINLIGKNPSPLLVRLMSTDKQVNSQTPPTFLCLAANDKAVPPENSILFFLALKNHHIPAEMHIYEVGGHGFGMRNLHNNTATWPARCADWMRQRKLLEKKKR